MPWIATVLGFLRDQKSGIYPGPGGAVQRTSKVIRRLENSAWRSSAALAFRLHVGDASWQAPTNLPMNEIPCVAIVAVLLLATPGPSAAADYKSFFGKTVAFRLAACADGKECAPGEGSIRTIQFDARGTLSEAFMLGDRTKREHAFGKTCQFRSGDGDTKKSITLSGRDNSIDIVAALTLLFSDGDSHRKVDTYRLTTTDGINCTLEGNRSMVDLPANSKRSLKIVGADCQLKP